MNDTGVGVGVDSVAGSGRSGIFSSRDASCSLTQGSSSRAKTAVIARQMAMTAIL